MNPLVAQHLDQVRKGIQDLSEALTQTHEQLAQHKQTREQLQKQNWAQAREIAVLKNDAQDIAQLREENKRFRQKDAQLRERLARILRYTAALTDESLS